MTPQKKEEIGRVIEESTPFTFIFKAQPEQPIALHDYVTVEMTQTSQNGQPETIQVLAEIVSLGVKNPLATERLSATGQAQAQLYSYKLLRAEILGYLNSKNQIIHPKVAAHPNSPVYPADDTTLQQYFHGDDKLIPLHLGKLMNRPNVTVPVHLQDMQFHLGIFASSVDYTEPFMYKENEVIKIAPIGDVLDRFFDGTEEGIKQAKTLQTVCFNPETLAVDWKPISYVYRHSYPEDLVRLEMETGRTVTVTPEHSVFILQTGEIRCVKASELLPGDYVVGARRVPDTITSNNSIDLVRIISDQAIVKEKHRKRFDSFYIYDFPDAFLGRIWSSLSRERPKTAKKVFWEHGVPGRYWTELTAEERRSVKIGYHSKAAKLPPMLEVDEALARMLGYYVAEGSVGIQNRLHYVTTFDLGANDEKTILPDLLAIVLLKFGSTASVVRKDNGIRVAVRNKPLALLASKLCGSGAERKRIPEEIMNSPRKVRMAFFKAWIAGDSGTTVSKSLMNQVLYTLLLDGCLGSCCLTLPNKKGHIGSRQFYSTRTAYHLNFPRPREVNLGILKQQRGRREPMYPIAQLPNPLRQFVKAKTKVLATGRMSTTVRARTIASLQKLLAYYGTGVKDYDATLHDGVYRVNRNRYFRSFKKKLIPNQQLRKIVAELEAITPILDSDLAFLKVKQTSKVKSASAYVYDVSVPEAENFLAGFGGVFCHNTRAGKSYLSGRFIEEIVTNTPFPILVIDVHADYVKMDQLIESRERHGDFDVKVFYVDDKAPKVEGVTADVDTLSISPSQLTDEQIAELLGKTLGERQIIDLDNILAVLRSRKKPFGLEDIVSEIDQQLLQMEMDKEKGKKAGEGKLRLESLKDRLEHLEGQITLPSKGMDLGVFFKPKTINIICLTGLRANIQDAYTSILLDLLFHHITREKTKTGKLIPMFIFVEEAHRVASNTGASRYSVNTISTVIREGAKFGMYMTLISQRPRSIDPDILSNVSNFAVLRISNPQDQEMIEKASENMSHRLVSDLPGLNQGEAVLVGPFVPLPAHIMTLPRKTVHHGVTPNLKAIMEQMEKDRKRASTGKF